MKLMKSTVFILLMLPLFVKAQLFTKKDSLRGSITPERSWWDLKHYNLSFDVDVDKKFIRGKNIISFEVLASMSNMQIDLQHPMQMDKVVFNGERLPIKKNGAAHFISLNERLPVGSIQQVEVHFSGHPKIAPHAPWDGGFTWAKDSLGKDFIATSCQTVGASLWWPCKDHMYDEPDRGTSISVAVPNKLTAVANGRLIKIDQPKEGKKTIYTWEVTHPINNYGININIGNYTYFNETFKGLNGKLDCSYYVLKQNLSKAKKHFTQVKQMLEAFEYWFGPYPFYEDSYKLVEVPYLGMEHQSSVTYGNNYQNGYAGRDLSQSGWGLKFDFIIIHESGHEWFANSITNKDVADMWIHESFTAYSESLFLEYYYGYPAAREYIIGTRNMILNDKPIIGHYHVNNEGSSDMYYKGANMIHMIRYILDNDMLWHQIFKDLHKQFKHQTVCTKDIENFIQKYSSTNLEPIFNQYLRSKQIPILEIKKTTKGLFLRFANCNKEFQMPLRFKIANKTFKSIVHKKWKHVETKEVDLTIPEDYLIDIKWID